MAGPGQILMEVRQTPDGGWGLVPYVPPAATPQGMGQAAAPGAPPQPSWSGLALVLGGTGLALWWAYKRWWKTDDGSRSHGGSGGYEREREDVREHGGERTRSSGYRGSNGGGGRSRYAGSYGRDAWQEKRHGREDAHETTARPDERRSRRSKARLMAEYKRLLDSQGV